MIGLKQIGHPSVFPPPPESGGLISWPHNRRAYGEMVQDWRGITWDMSSHDHSTFSSNHLVSDDGAAFESWPHDVTSPRHLATTTEFLASWPHNVASLEHTYADPLNPVEPPPVDPPVAKKAIVFACDYGGLLISTGATLQAPATIAANGSLAVLRPVWSAQPVETFLVSKRFGISPRAPNPDINTASYRTQLGSGFDGSICSGAYVSCVHYTQVLTGATFTGEREASVRLDGADASGFVRIYDTCRGWQRALEASAFNATRHWTYGFRSLVRFDYGAGDDIALSPHIYHNPALGFGFDLQIWPAIYGGSWTATFDGHTATIPHDATAAQISALLNALPSVSSNGGLRVALSRQDLATREQWAALKPTQALHPVTNEHLLQLFQQ